jgi:hypothetical protein
LPRQADESEASTAEADADTDSASGAEINGPDAEPLMASTEEFADSAVTATETFGDAVSDSIEESVKDDVRASVQEDLVTEIRGSLPLFGQD